MIDPTLYDLDDDETPRARRFRASYEASVETFRADGDADGDASRRALAECADSRRPLGGEGLWV